VVGVDFILSVEKEMSIYRKKKGKHRLSVWLMRRLKDMHFVESTQVSRDFFLLLFFVFLFAVIVLRLAYLQIFRANYYESLLGSLHISESLLKAERGHIYATDNAGKPVQLTENITMYDVFVDPKFVWDKPRFIELFVPVVYQHLCPVDVEAVEKAECMKNIEGFTKKSLLPKEPEFFYFGSGIISEDYENYDWTGFWEQYDATVANFTTGTALSLIKQRLDERIYIGINNRNYL